VLASASPRRQELLSARGVPFVADAPDVDEHVPEGVEPRDAAVGLARRKARAVAPRHPAGTPILAADTLVVAADGRVLGKPADAADAARMLRSLSGTTQRVITGVCVLHPGGEIVDAVETRVTMREMGADEIAAYVASGEPFGKAGGYAIQETGDRFVVAVDGSRSNVVGLPVERVVEMLRTAGVAVAGAA